MILKNTIHTTNHFNVKRGKNSFIVSSEDFKSEYAVIAFGEYGEKLLDIIKTDCEIFFCDEDYEKTYAVTLTDIYSDKEVFRAEITHEDKKETISGVKDEEKTIIPSEYERKHTEDKPPKLVTKKRQMKKTDTSFLEKLRKFNFPCLAGIDHDIRIFDENTIREHGIRVNYCGLSVPAWYPYLGYRDITVKDCDFPAKIIGTDEINGRQYLLYGHLTNIKKGIQPFFGSTGYVYLCVIDDDYGYWVMYLDIETGEVRYPHDDTTEQETSLGA